MRCAVTIIYEGVHHLKHLDFAEKMAQLFDHWIVVEGHSQAYGSTRWCNNIQVPARSTDGTIEFMKQFAATHKNVHFYHPNGYFNSKDHQANAGITILRQLSSKCFLWQVDADEHWTIESIEKAEQFALASSEIGFKFQFNHYVGPGIIAVGDWGSGYLNRLWKWNGEFFRSHEPALLRGQRITIPVPDIKYDHYSYYFEKDVRFKAIYYPDCKGIEATWPTIQKPNDYPLHISKLFPVGKHGKSNTQIVQI